MNNFTSMGWFKYNWFKLSLIVILFWIGHNLIYSESEEKNGAINVDATKNDRLCAQDGKKWLDEYRQDTANYLDSNEHIELDAEYNYNNAMDRCYIRFTQHNGSANGIIEHQLIDLYRNRMIYISRIQLRPDDINRTNKRIYLSGLSEEDFIDKAKEYMSD